jgi:hypothetical protein
MVMPTGTRVQSAVSFPEIRKTALARFETVPLACLACARGKEARRRAALVSVSNDDQMGSLEIAALAESVDDGLERCVEASVRDMARVLSTALPIVTSTGSVPRRW